MVEKIWYKIVEMFMLPFVFDVRIGAEVFGCFAGVFMLFLGHTLLNIRTNYVHMPIRIVDQCPRARRPRPELPTPRPLPPHHLPRLPPPKLLLAQVQLAPGPQRLDHNPNLLLPEHSPDPGLTPSNLRHALLLDLH